MIETLDILWAIIVRALAFFGIMLGAIATTALIMAIFQTKEEMPSHDELLSGLDADKRSQMVKDPPSPSTQDFDILYIDKYRRN